MPKLPRYLSRLQKRARDKESRLRRRGANAIDVEAASPRLPASEVASMTAREQRAYARRLRNFNARSNSYVVSESGGLVQRSTWNRIQAEVDRYNRWAEAQRRRINGLIAGTPIAERPSFESVEARLRATGARVDANGYVGAGSNIMGRVTRLENVTVPRDQRAAERRLETLRRMNRPGVERERREMVRESVMEMLAAMGKNREVDVVRRLTPDQFDVLTVMTTFMNDILVQYDPSDFSGDVAQMGHDERMEWFAQSQAPSFAEDRITHDIEDVLINVPRNIWRS